MNSAEENPPQNPPSIVTLNGAPSAEGRKIRLTENKDLAEKGLIRVNDSTLRELYEFGILAENIGLLKLANGAVFATVEGCYKFEKAILARLEEVSERSDFEATATLANAYASIAKSKAATFKSVGSLQMAPPSERRGRKSFAKGAALGPIMDVKAA